MNTVVTIIHITTCLIMVVVILLQSGKGAEISASFGGSSQTVFGSSGGANFFTKLTSWLAAIFMATSITLTLIGSQNRKSIFEGAPLPKPVSKAQTTAPLAPAPSAPPAAKSAAAVPAPVVAPASSKAPVPPKRQ